MRRSLLVSDEICGFLRSLPPSLKKKVRYVLDEIQPDPLCGKSLVEELAGFRSYRLGSFRIVYRTDQTTVTLIAIGPRLTIYEKAAIELKKIKTGKKRDKLISRSLRI